MLKQEIQLLSESKYEQAIGAVNPPKQESPLDPRPYSYSGMPLTQAGGLLPAALELKEAVRLKPGDPVYRIFLANIYSRLKQKTHALAMIRGQDAYDAGKSEEARAFAKHCGFATWDNSRERMQPCT
ncbi:MAG TPA: hypothetical protein VFQ24_18970 [Terriglobia bacterium]|nr:hypothetical protein [Terriglobia bacterium]